MSHICRSPRRYLLRRSKRWVEGIGPGTVYWTTAKSCAAKYSYVEAICMAMIAGAEKIHEEEVKR
jgi:hypothetical protein